MGSVVSGFVLLVIASKVIQTKEDKPKPASPEEVRRIMSGL